MGRTTDMTVGNPTKLILKFAIPLIITNLGQQFYMIADASIVGRGVGVKAFASVGATDWCYWLILWTITGLTQGFSTFTSRYFGDKNYIDTNKSIAMSAILCAVIGSILTVLGLLTAKPLLLILNTPKDILDGAVIYLSTMISGTVIVAAYNMSASILRAFGDGKTPLIAMIISAFLNIGLDILFVFVFGIGIFGAALASVISQLVSFIYCLIGISKIECVKLPKHIWKPDFKMIKSMTLFGMPVAIQHIVIALGGIILQSSINMQGSIFIAGYTATNKLYGMLESSSISLGLASSTFLAQNYGAKNFDRFKKGVVASVKIVVGMAFFVSLSVLPIRKYLLQLFLNINEPGGPEALEVAIYYITIVLVCLVILYLLHIFKYALQAMGISVWSMVSGLSEFAVRVIMSKVIINIIGTNALFIAEPVSWLGATLAVMLPYFYYRTKLLNNKDVN